MPLEPALNSPPAGDAYGVDSCGDSSVNKKRTELDSASKGLSPYYARYYEEVRIIGVEIT
jgi:hypothetical protein